MAWVGTFLTRRGREDGIITATQREIVIFHDQTAGASKDSSFFPEND